MTRDEKRKNKKKRKDKIKTMGGKEIKIKKGNKKG